MGGRKRQVLNRNESGIMMMEKMGWCKWLFFLVVVLFLLLVVVASLNGPTHRHDDLWYMRNLQTFVCTGKMVSNQIFPVMIAKDSCEVPLVTHNLPSIYLIAPFVILLGSYWGWIVANILFTLLSCWLLINIGGLLEWSIQKRVMCGACFLVFPISVYMSSHALSEAGTAPLVLLICYVLLKMNESTWKWVLIGLLAALATLNRASLMVMALLIPLLTLFCKEKRLLGRVGTMACFFLSFTIFLSVGHAIFPQADIGGTGTLLKTYGSMNHYYALYPMEFSFSKLMERTFLGMHTALLGRKIGELAFLLPLNTLILWVFLRRTRGCLLRISILRYYAITLIATHFATLVVVQFQHRYIHVIYPVLLLFFFASIDLKTTSSRLFRVGLGLFICGNLIVSAAYAKKNYAEGGRTREIIAAYTPATEFLKGKGAGLIVGGNDRLHAWLFPDNRTLVVRPVLTTDELLMMREKVPFCWMICPSNSVVLDRLAMLRPIPEEMVSIPLNSFKLYHFQVEPAPLDE